MTAKERGSQDLASNDKCPRCGAVFMADSGESPPGYPIPSDHQVTCFMCDHTGPIKDWWDAFDKEFSRDD